MVSAIPGFTYNKSFAITIFCQFIISANFNKLHCSDKFNNPHCSKEFLLLPVLIEPLTIFWLMPTTISCTVGTTCLLLLLLTIFYHCKLNLMLPFPIQIFFTHHNLLVNHSYQSSTRHLFPHIEIRKP